MPHSAPEASPDDREAVERALEYMALEPGTPIQEIEIDRVFVGSCTNSRIEDLRTAASVLEGKRVHESVKAMVVPGSAAVKRMAEEGGLGPGFPRRGIRLA